MGGREAGRQAGLQPCRPVGRPKQARCRAATACSWGSRATVDPPRRRRAARACVVGVAAGVDAVQVGQAGPGAVDGGAHRLAGDAPAPVPPRQPEAQLRCTRAMEGEGCPGKLGQAPRPPARLRSPCKGRAAVAARLAASRPHPTAHTRLPGGVCPRRQPPRRPRRWQRPLGVPVSLQCMGSGRGGLQWSL